jgi:hypothetical protein
LFLFSLLPLAETKEINLDETVITDESKIGQACHEVDDSMKTKEEEDESKIGQTCQEVDDSKKDENSETVPLTPRMELEGQESDEKVTKNKTDIFIFFFFRLH